MDQKFSVSTADTVSVFISTSYEENCMPIEKRFDKSLPIKDLKNKLELVIGASSNTLKIKVYNKDDKFLFEIDEDERLLGSYPVDSGMRLHIEDAFLLKKMFSDESNVEKFDLTVEQYEKRDDTLRAYLAKNKLGKYNPEEQAKKDAERKQEEEAEEKAANSIKVSDRCEVSIPGQPTRKAEVMFVGMTKFKPGWWIGVKYDEPMGKNDGSINGVRYFECSPKYGGFVKPMYIEVGDFPEEELDFDDEI